ncbi:MAG: type II toxin-antitoxin system death-on-curing family toxin [Candidatus Tectomicrobia bacterium]|nr:type II toxin-antitoxin system death-on-curing family toxin [Candidatus Tectomicrobia bacterium]
MKRQPRWLTVPMVRAIHAEHVMRFGGRSGLRDAGLLESALQRPRQLWHYGDRPTLFDLAAALSLSLAKNHPFIDGNKRTALLAGVAFLALNGWTFRPPQGRPYHVMMAAASGQADEAVLAGWFRENSVRH